MKQSSTFITKFVLSLTLLTILLSFVNTASAQPKTVTYDLDNVWLDPDISHTWENPRQLTGSFVWSYETGDFENGSGVFTSLQIPWYDPGLSELESTIDLTSIEITFPGNLHDIGIDITLFLIDPLSPDQSSDIDLVRSKFDIQNGVSYQGHVISGAIVPLNPAMNLEVSGTCPSNVQIFINNVTPSGQIALLYANAQGTFVIPDGFPCAGTALGLSSATLGALIIADSNGEISLNTTVPPAACSNIYIQALDLTNCETSNVVLLQ